MLDEPHHAHVLRNRTLEKRKFQVTMGIGHARDQNTVVVFGLRQRVDVFALLRADDRAVGGEMHHPVAHELTVGGQEVRGRHISRDCRDSVFHNKDIIESGIR